MLMHEYRNHLHNVRVTLTHDEHEDTYTVKREYFGEEVINPDAGYTREFTDLDAAHAHYREVIAEELETVLENRE